ncbi:hypothetical protein C7408_13116 [Paraburkholderia caballeronis]|nr:hypothetical protein C7408_13116 [Paraburkholderia caballeronis]TDV07897.1 hypothetical protein C7406_13316 [Paraburkholderia caballeronis]TDV18188.1 hypothetical protein C7404_13116 [Paraburkholderia caballeronis]
MASPTNRHLEYVSALYGVLVGASAALLAVLSLYMYFGAPTCP